MQNVLLLINPLFNQTRRQRITLDRVVTTLRAAGLRVESLEALSALQSGDQARDAVAAGFDTILICGGDGTLFHALQGLAGSKVAVGIIPLGTGNVVAQNLRLPRDPVKAASELLSARVRTVPLGSIICSRSNDRASRNWYFVFAAGVGLHAALMSLAPEGNGKRLGGRAAYYVGGLRLLLRAPIQPFEIEVTSVTDEVSVHVVSEAIAVRVPEINRWRPGGNLASPTLRLALIPQTSRLGLAHASLRALLASKPPSLSSDALRDVDQSHLPCARYMDAMRVVCRPLAGFQYREPLLIQADGEVLGDTSATITITDQTVSILCPTGQSA